MGMLMTNKWYSNTDDDTPDHEILRKAAALMRATATLLTAPDGCADVELDDDTCDVFSDLLRMMAEDVLSIRMSLMPSDCQGKDIGLG